MKHVVHKCPQCGNELIRIRRTNLDRIIHVLSFNTLYNKRYYCYSCLRSFIFNKRILRNWGEQETGMSSLKEKVSTHTSGVIVISVLLLTAVLIVLAGNNYFSKARMSHRLSIVNGK